MGKALNLALNCEVLLGQLSFKMLAKVCIQIKPNQTLEFSFFNDRNLTYQVRKLIKFDHHWKAVDGAAEHLMPSLMIGTCILLSHLSCVITSLPESRIAIMLWNQTVEFSRSRFHNFKAISLELFWCFNKKQHKKSSAMPFRNCTLFLIISLFNLMDFNFDTSITQ